MMGKRLLMAAALLLAATVPAFAADVTGTWTLSMTGPQGPEVFDIVLTPAADGFEVSGTHPMLGEGKGNGSVNGDAIAMTFTTAGDMKVKFTFEGTVDGDSMSGTREFEMAGGGAPGGPPGNAPAGGPPGEAPAGAPQGGPPGAPGGGDMAAPPNDWKAVRK